jgi:hypothetical protein
MLNFFETCFLKRFMPVAKVLLLVFACKSNTLDPTGVIVLIASTSQVSDLHLFDFVLFISNFIHRQSLIRSATHWIKLGKSCKVKNQFPRNVVSDLRLSVNRGRGSRRALRSGCPLGLGKAGSKLH